jgi:uncharacterized OB-fold protein
MATGAKKKKIPIKEGIFKLTEGDDGYLTGSQCQACKETFFPKRFVCANCFSEKIKEISLGKKGRIVSYTIARTGFPGAAVIPPFISGIVELPYQLRLVTLITGYDFDKVQIGDEVDLYFWVAGEDDQGNELMAYAFRSAQK